jgi:hypothetical protein
MIFSGVFCGRYRRHAKPARAPFRSALLALGPVLLRGGASWHPAAGSYGFVGSRAAAPEWGREGADGRGELGARVASDRGGSPARCSPQAASFVAPTGARCRRQTSQYTLPLSAMGNSVYQTTYCAPQCRHKTLPPELIVGGRIDASYTSTPYVADFGRRMTPNTSSQAQRIIIRCQ